MSEWDETLLPPHVTLTKAQQQVVNTEGVTLIGWDAKFRPVVEGPVGIPARTQRWALLKNGDPTDITPGSFTPAD